MRTVVALSFGLWAFSFEFSSAAAPDYPVFVAQLPNPNDYSLFANSGWDGNWYAGYNTCWIKKLPAIPPGSYSRAFIGAKLGRMKLESTGKKPWERDPLPGSIYMALSSTSAWTPEQSHAIAKTIDIPLEGDPENAIEASGESQWFWAEIPIEQVNTSGDNYLALWSPTPSFVTVSSSPVLAAGWGGKEIDTWISRDIHGSPSTVPKDPPGTGISYFQPAMALKLIPAGASHPMTVRLINWRSGTPDHLKPVITASVEGDSVERVWVEYATSVRRGDVVRGGWSQVGRPLWKAPYIFSLEQTRLPQGKIRLRVAAVNVWEEESVSAPFTVEVSTVNANP